jgi:hypothetical protein
MGGNGVQIVTDSTTSATTWNFNASGDILLPTGGDIVDETGASQLARRVQGEWLVAPGTNNYSFTVDWNNTYILWVRANIPNGIIVWNATVTVTNANVPIIGQQFAWTYTGGGSPISLTSIPSQIIGTPGAISTGDIAVVDSNTFVFGISNTSGANQTVEYGYTKI